jgi:hypothetical protein
MAIAKQNFQTFSGTASQPDPSSDYYVTVLYGYGKPDGNGRIGTNRKSFLDEFEGVDGVFRNIPRERAEQWAKGLDKNGKPARSRVYIQAILPNDAQEEHFIAATGKNTIPQEKLAAYIKASDVDALIEMLGREGATELHLRLSRELAKK